MNSWSKSQNIIESREDLLKWLIPMKDFSNRDYSTRFCRVSNFIWRHSWIWRMCPLRRAHNINFSFTLRHASPLRKTKWSFLCFSLRETIGLPFKSQARPLKRLAFNQLRRNKQGTQFFTQENAGGKCFFL